MLSALHEPYVPFQQPGTPRDDYSPGQSAFNVNNADASRQLIHARNGAREEYLQQSRQMTEGSRIYPHKKSKLFCNEYE